MESGVGLSTSDKRKRSDAADGCSDMFAQCGEGTLVTYEASVLLEAGVGGGFMGMCSVASMVVSDTVKCLAPDKSRWLEGQPSGEGHHDQDSE